MQHELQHHGAGLAQHALEIVDLAVALRGGLGADVFVHHGHQHVFVVAAVVDHHLARGGQLLLDAPQEVVAALQLGRRLPGVGAHAQRAGFLEHRADRAVLARRVHALQQHQQLETLVGPEHVLQRIDLVCQLAHAQPILVLVTGAEGLGVGRAVLQGEALAAHRHVPRRGARVRVAVALFGHWLLSFRLRIRPAEARCCGEDVGWRRLSGQIGLPDRRAVPCGAGRGAARRQAGASGHPGAPIGAPGYLSLITFQLTSVPYYV